MTPASPDRALVRTWLARPLPRDVVGPLDRLARTPGVVRIAVMPDVHWAEGVAVGVVVGARDRVFPDAVGKDIGCGMAAEAYAGVVDRLRDPTVSARVIDDLARVVPTHRQSGPALRATPEAFPDPSGLSAAPLARVAARDGRVQFGTLGRGNHFLEVQADDEGTLYAMVHSGSRGVGPAIHAHHLRNARRDRVGVAGIPATAPEGVAYLSDVRWALAYAEGSRAAMLDALAQVLADRLGVLPVPGTRFGCLHNHAREEVHFGERLWVHRKGAVSATGGEPGIVPGSMGTWSYHTEGRGEPESLSSCSHGAGRALPRGEARRRITLRDLRREMRDVAFDERLAADLVEEAPSAYQDVGAVMRAQSDLVRIVRRLRPVLVHKGA